MKIVIKNVPILTDQEAITFERNADSAFRRKGTVDFKKEKAIALKILAKAKF